MSGAGEIDLTSRSILKNTRARLPWLFASFIGGILAAYIIGNFETQLKRAAALAAFIPIIMGMGGNIGTQSSTIVVRGLATGGINLKETWQVLWRELVNGTSIGLTYGLMLSLFARLPFWDFSTEEASWRLPTVVGVATCANMVVAATVGTIIPLLFKYINVDPAVAIGSFCYHCYRCVGHSVLISV